MLTQPRPGEELEARSLAEWLLGAPQRLLVVMGLPASGKSTLCQWLEQLGAVRVNRDAIRKRLYGDESVMGDTKVVNSEYYKELRAALAKRGVVVSDNVNITPFHRKGTIGAARENGYTDIMIVWVDVPLEVALERNKARTRQVPEEAIRSMHADLQKYGDPPPTEGNLVVLHNGKDKDHYVVAKLRVADPVPAQPSQENPPMPSNSNDGDADNKARRVQLVSDLSTQVRLLDACVAAGRDAWAAETLAQIRTLSDAGVPLFGGTAGGGTPTPAPAKRKYPPITPADINEVLLKMIGHRPYVTNEGPLVMLSFNGHLLDKEKAETLLEPLLELVKRAHIVFFQETNVDAVRVIGRAAHYGISASHRNNRGQACGFLFHPRLQWLGNAPLYHDYLLKVPGHPEYEATMRPAIQRRVKDLVSGWVFDVLNFHGKSNLGGPDATRPIRHWQFQALMDELAKQKVTSPWQPREQVGKRPVDNTGYDLPLGAAFLGGDYNAPIENPATTETEPLLKFGFVRQSTPNNDWSYQYKGNGGQFDGFFSLCAEGLVTECFIPPFTDNKRTELFYSKLSDHRPVFITVQPPAAPAKTDPTPAAAPTPSAPATDAPAADAPAAAPAA